MLLKDIKGLLPEKKYFELTLRVHSDFSSETDEIENEEYNQALLDCGNVDLQLDVKEVACKILNSNFPFFKCIAKEKGVYCIYKKQLAQVLSGKVRRKL